MVTIVSVLFLTASFPTMAVAISTSSPSSNTLGEAERIPTANINDKEAASLSSFGLSLYAENLLSAVKRVFSTAADSRDIEFATRDECYRTLQSVSNPNTKKAGAETFLVGCIPTSDLGIAASDIPYSLPHDSDYKTKYWDPTDRFFTQSEASRNLSMHADIVPPVGDPIMRNYYNESVVKGFVFLQQVPWVQPSYYPEIPTFISNAVNVASNVAIASERDECAAYCNQRYIDESRYTPVAASTEIIRFALAYGRCTCLGALKSSSIQIGSARNPECCKPMPEQPTPIGASNKVNNGKGAFPNVEIAYYQQPAACNRYERYAVVYQLAVVCPINTTFCEYKQATCYERTISNGKPAHNKCCLPVGFVATQGADEGSGTLNGSVVQFLIAGILLLVILQFAYWLFYSKIRRRFGRGSTGEDGEDGLGELREGDFIDANGRIVRGMGIGARGGALAGDAAALAQRLLLPADTELGGLVEEISQEDVIGRMPLWADVEREMTLRNRVAARQGLEIVLIPGQNNGLPISVVIKGRSVEERDAAASEAMRLLGPVAADDINDDDQCCPICTDELTEEVLGIKTLANHNKRNKPPQTTSQQQQAVGGGGGSTSTTTNSSSGPHQGTPAVHGGGVLVQPSLGIDSAAGNAAINVDDLDDAEVDDDDLLLGNTRNRNPHRASIVSLGSNRRRNNNNNNGGDADEIELEDILPPPTRTNTPNNLTSGNNGNNSTNNAPPPIPFEDSSNVVSLACRHLIHRECMHEYIAHTVKSYLAPITCPLCRGIVVLQNLASEQEVLKRSLVEFRFIVESEVLRLIQLGATAIISPMPPPSSDGTQPLRPPPRIVLSDGGDAPIRTNAQFSHLLRNAEFGFAELPNMPPIPPAPLLPLVTREEQQDPFSVLAPLTLVRRGYQRESVMIGYGMRARHTRKEIVALRMAVILRLKAQIEGSQLLSHTRVPTHFVGAQNNNNNNRDSVESGIFDNNDSIVLPEPNSTTTTQQDAATRERDGGGGIAQRASSPLPLPPLAPTTNRTNASNSNATAGSGNNNNTSFAGQHQQGSDALIRQTSSGAISNSSAATNGTTGSPLLVWQADARGSLQQVPNTHLDSLFTAGQHRQQTTSSNSGNATTMTANASGTAAVYVPPLLPPLGSNSNHQPSSASSHRQRAGSRTSGSSRTSRTGSSSRHHRRSGGERAGSSNNDRTTTNPLFTELNLNDIPLDSDVSLAQLHRQASSSSALNTPRTGTTTPSAVPLLLPPAAARSTSNSNATNTIVANNVNGAAIITQTASSRIENNNNNTANSAAAPLSSAATTAAAAVPPLPNLSNAALSRGLSRPTRIVRRRGLSVRAPAGSRGNNTRNNGNGNNANAVAAQLSHQPTSEEAGSIVSRAAATVGTALRTVAATVGSVVTGPPLSSAFSHHHGSPRRVLVNEYDPTIVGLNDYGELPSPRREDYEDAEIAAAAIYEEVRAASPVASSQQQQHQQRGPTRNDPDSNPLQLDGDDSDSVLIADDSFTRSMLEPEEVASLAGAGATRVPISPSTTYSNNNNNSGSDNSAQHRQRVVTRVVVRPRRNTQSTVAGSVGSNNSISSPTSRTPDRNIITNTTATIIATAITRQAESVSRPIGVVSGPPSTSLPNGAGYLPPASARELAFDDDMDDDL